MSDDFSNWEEEEGDGTYNGDYNYGGEGVDFVDDGTAYVDDSVEGGGEEEYAEGDEGGDELGAIEEGEEEGEEEYPEAADDPNDGDYQPEQDQAYDQDEEEEYGEGDEMEDQAQLAQIAALEAARHKPNLRSSSHAGAAAPSAFGNNKQSSFLGAFSGATNPASAFGSTTAGAAAPSVFGASGRSGAFSGGASAFSQMGGPAKPWSAAGITPANAAPCRFGRACHREDCYFAHPDGRDIDDAAGQLSVPKPGRSSGAAAAVSSLPQQSAFTSAFTAGAAANTHSPARHTSAFGSAHAVDSPMTAAATPAPSAFSPTIKPNNKRDKKPVVITTASGAAAASATAVAAAIAANAPMAIERPVKPVKEKPEKPGRESKKDKKERGGKKDKQNKHGAHTSIDATPAAAAADGGMDTTDALATRSRRFSNMSAPPAAAPSLSLSPPAFRGHAMASPPSVAVAPVSSASRSTASLMAAAMGNAPIDDGGDEGELFSAENFRAIIGQCQMMCPLEEQAARMESRDLSYFEIIPGTGSKEHGDVPQVDPEKAVKKYKRAAAAQTLNPKDVRPPHILKKTMAYLVTQIMDRQDTPDPPPLPSFLVRYRFISDRMRALRQDYHCQMQKDAAAINSYEIMVRFHILTMYELGDLNMIEKWDPTPNMEKLSQTLTSLRHMFWDNYTNRLMNSHTQISTPNEPEMHSYRLLSELDRHFGTLYEELDKFDPSIKSSPIIQFCVQVSNAFRENNYARFFQLAKKAPYFHAILLQGYFTKVRARALEVISSSYISYPIDAFTELLMFESQEHAVEFIRYYNVSVDETQSNIVRSNYSVFTRPETIFPFRNCHRIIAEKRPKKISQAVLMQIGTGEGYGLDMTSSSTTGRAVVPSLKPTRQITIKPAIKPLQIAAPTANPLTQLPPSSMFPSALAPTTTFGGSSFGPPIDIDVDPAASSKPIKLERRGAPALQPTSLLPAAALLNPNATPFQPSTTSTQPTFGESAFGRPMFNSGAAAPPAASNNKPTPTGATPPSSAWPQPTTQPPKISTPIVKPLSTPKHDAVPSPSVKPNATFNFPPTSNPIASYNAGPPSLTTNPSPPALTSFPVTQIPGLHLPAPPALPLTNQNSKITVPTATNPSTFPSTKISSPQLPPAIVRIKEQPIQPAQPNLIPHTRPPLVHNNSHMATSSTLQVPPSAPVSTPTVVVRQPPARVEIPPPTPAQANAMFLAALHFYKRTLIRSHLHGWIDVFNQHAQKQRELEMRADRFLATKIFLRWHSHYVEAEEYRRRFYQQQQNLHAPLAHSLLTPSKQHQPQQQQLQLYQSPSKSNQQLISSPPTFLPSSFRMAAGLAGPATPLAKLTMLGIALPGENEEGEEVDEGEEYEGENQNGEDADGDYTEEQKYGDQSEEEEAQYNYQDDQDMEYVEEVTHHVNDSSFSPFTSTSSTFANNLSTPAPSSVFLSPSPQRNSGIKRTRNSEPSSASSSSSSHLHFPTGPPNGLSPMFAVRSSLIYDDANTVDEDTKENGSDAQRVKLFHTPSRMQPRAVFSTPNDSSSASSYSFSSSSQQPHQATPKDLLQTLREEMAHSNKLNELLESLERQFERQY